MTARRQDPKAYQVPDLPEAANGPTPGRAATFVGATLVAALLVFAALALAAREGREAFTGGWAVSGLSLHEQMGQWTTLETKIRLAETRDPVDVVAIGDSSCLFGFDPARFEEGTGLTALNLATHGRAEMGGHLAILRRMADRGGVRRAVVLWIHPRAARADMSPDDPMNFRPWVERRIADRGALREGVLAETNDLWGGLLRFRLLEKNLARRRGEGFTTPRSAMERIVRHDGWLPSEPRPFPGRDRQTELHPDAIAGMRSIAAYCRAKGLPLFVAVTPFVAGSPVEPGHHAKLLREIAEEVPGATVVTTFPEFLAPGLFHEPGHVTSEGAGILTEALAAVVAPRSR